jgi:hypothetical protein
MTSIRVNVYDLTALNRLLRCARIGVYHTSVVIAEQQEYYYGFAAKGYTGIDCPSKLDHLPNIMTGSFLMTIPMGESPYDIRKCGEIMRALLKSKRWMSEYYHILFHNCNNFTFELCETLLGKDNVGDFPHWVQRGVNIASVIYSISVGYIIGLKMFSIPALGDIPPPDEGLPEAQAAPRLAEPVDIEAVIDSIPGPRDDAQHQNEDSSESTGFYSSSED